MDSRVRALPTSVEAGALASGRGTEPPRPAGVLGTAEAVVVVLVVGVVPVAIGRTSVVLIVVPGAAAQDPFPAHPSISRGLRTLELYLREMAENLQLWSGLITVCSLLASVDVLEHHITFL